MKKKEQKSSDIDYPEKQKQKKQESIDESILEDESSSKEFRADIVSDNHSLSDGSHVDKRQLFVKTWTVKNTGEKEWLDGTKIVYRGRKGNPLVAQQEFPVKTPVKPGENVDVSVVVRVPNAPGQYLSNWRLVTPTGITFGQKLTCRTDIDFEYTD